MRKDIWAVCGRVRESESVTKICESQKSFVRLCKLKRVLREKKSRSRAENICVWGARCTSRSERIWAIEEAVEPPRWPSSIFVHSSCACIRAESSLLSLALSLAWVCFTRYRSKLEPFRERILSGAWSDRALNGMCWITIQRLIECTCTPPENNTQHIWKKSNPIVLKSSFFVRFWKSLQVVARCMKSSLLFWMHSIVCLFRHILDCQQ